MTITIEQKIRELAANYAADLKQKMEDRVAEMKEDDNSHLR
jgi:hypothetical protein